MKVFLKAAGLALLSTTLFISGIFLYGFNDSQAGRTSHVVQASKAIHDLNDGREYTSVLTLELNTAEFTGLFFKAPSTRPGDHTVIPNAHFWVEANSPLSSQIYLIKDPASTTWGGNLAAINSNTSSSNTAAGDVDTLPATGLMPSGTAWDNFLFGDGVPYHSGRKVLAAGESVGISVVSADNANPISIRVTWVEPIVEF